MYTSFELFNNNRTCNMNINIIIINHNINIRGTLTLNLCRMYDYVNHFHYMII